MNIITNYSKFITESISDIAYHFTNVVKVQNILKNDTFYLSNVLGSKSDYVINRNHLFFLSTTRSKKSGYVTGNIKIVLDGRKLNNNFKSISVDYWQYSKNPKHWSEQDYINALSSEQEDRIVSNKPIIKNASKYIKAIHILIHPSFNYDSIIEKSKERNIPLYFYNSDKDWLNEKNQVGLDELPKVKPYKETEDNYFNVELATFIVRNNKEAYDEISKYVEDDVMDSIDNRLKKGEFHMYIPALKSDLNNIRHKQNRNDIFLLNLLTKHMKKNNIYTLEDYAKKHSGEFNKQESMYNYAINSIDNSFSDKLDTLEDTMWVEINGKTYNSVIESPEITKSINNKLKEIKQVIKDGIFNKGYTVIDGIYIKEEVHLKVDYLKDVNISNAYFSTDKLNDIIYRFFISVLGDFSSRMERYNI